MIVPYFQATDQEEVLWGIRNQSSVSILNKIITGELSNY